MTSSVDSGRGTARLAAGAIALLWAGCGGSSAGAGSSSNAKHDAGGVDTAVGCKVKKPADYNPTIDAADFAAGVPNKWLPIEVGSVARSVDGDGNTGEVTITSDTKVLLGVTCTVIHDVAKDKNGVLLEDTYDWVAQDKLGNVWYFGEDTKEYQNGKLISTEGSWTAGVDCAKPGVLMEADPQVGDRYREEYHAGDAEDEAEILSLDESVEVQSGKYDHCLKTHNFTALEPGMAEDKYYCPDVGEVLAEEIVKVGTGKREELVDRTTQ